MTSSVNLQITYLYEEMFLATILVVVQFFTGMISFSSTSPTIYLLNMAPYDFRMNNLATSDLGTWPAKCFVAECACFLLFLSIYIQPVTIIIA